METRVDEVADRIHRISTYVPDADFTFNQYLIAADEPLLFHTGFRSLFPLVSEAVGRVVPVERLRWITFGHVEGDEAGSMNQWLAAAPHATVAHGAMACAVQVNDLADRPPRPLADGEVIDLGSHRVRNVDTPHVPHGWDAHVLYEETTGTLFCGDLFTAMGAHEVSTDGDIVEPAIAAETVFKATSLTPATAPTIRGLADLDVKTLALMHGPAFTGDSAKALRALADAYERLHAEAAAA
jgi:flavorubredoxin